MLSKDSGTPGKRLVVGAIASALIGSGCQCHERLGGAQSVLVARWGDGGEWGGGTLAAPVPLDFGNVQVGTAVTRTVQLEDLSGVSVNVSRVAFDGGSSAFAESHNGGTVLAGAVLPLQVAVAPTAVGRVTAALEIHSDATGAALIEVPLRANGTPGIELIVRPEANPDAGITVSLGAPLTLDFGETYVNTPKVAQIDVLDVGTQGVTLAPIAFADGGSADFAVLQPASPSIPPDGGRLSFTVSFTPSRGEDARSALVLTSTDRTVSTTVGLAGESEPRLELCDSNGNCAASSPWVALAFGAVQGGSQAIQQFSIDNVGWAPLTYSTQFAPGTSQEFSLGAPLSGTLDAGSSVTLSVSLTPAWSPTSTTTYGGSVNVGSNDPTQDAGPGVVDLTGSCDSTCQSLPPPGDAGCGVGVGTQGCTTQTDSFSSGALNGWTFVGQATPATPCSGNCASGSCDCSRQNLGYQLATDPDAGAAEILGDLCSTHTLIYGFVSGGMQKTFTINPGHMRIAFNWRATSCYGFSSVTNATVSLVNPSTQSRIWSAALSPGGTLDTGWQHYQADVSCSVQGMSQVTVVLSLVDAWDADWQETDWFNQISVTTCTQ